MKRKTIGIIALVATAAGAAIFALTQLMPQDVPPTETVPAITVTASPTAVEEFKPCYYVWAYQALPEITDEFQAAIADILPDAEATASAYGENCVAEDGTFTFGAMETDFYVTLPVDDLNDKAALGDIVEQVLTLVIEQFPRPHVPGGQDGFVEFSFVAGTETHILRAPIPLAKELLEKGLRGAELLQALESQ